MKVYIALDFSGLIEKVFLKEKEAAEYCERKLRTVRIEEHEVIE